MCLLVTLKPNQTKHSLQTASQTSPNVQIVIYKCLDLQPLEWLPKASLSLFGWNVLLILAWIVFADNNNTVTVIWAFIEHVCQPLCRALYMQCLLLSHCSALLMTDCRPENQGSKEGSRLPRCPTMVCGIGLFVEFLHVFLMLLLSSFRLGHLACKALSLENIPCAAVSAFPFAVSWCKERENNTGQCFE